MLLIFVIRIYIRMVLLFKWISNGIEIYYGTFH